MSAAQKKSAASSAARSTTDDEAQRELREIHRWERISGPHSIGLANLQTWVTAFSMGILESDEESHGEPTGIITA